MKLFEALLLAAALSAGANAALAQPPGAAPQPPAFDGASSHEMRADAVMADFPDFSGAVAVSRDGRVVFRKAYGQADRELSVPSTPETRFRIASVTKQFTAVAILQLAEAGKLKLDDPVSKYYPDAPATWAPVTIHHLLTHTSGTPSFTNFPNLVVALAPEDRTPGKIVELTHGMPLDFAPGTRFAYNNTGYVLLGLVIEKASGVTYADYVQKHILQPAGMTSSGYDVPEKFMPRQAVGYEIGAAGVVKAPDLLDMRIQAPGGLFSTVDDLMTWDEALRNGKVLAPASSALMFKDHGFRYGYGWQIDRRYGHDLVMHDGGIRGFSAAYVRYPSQKLAIAVLSNVFNGPSVAISDRLAAVYLNAPARTATPGGEAAVRKLIEDVKRGEPDYARMSEVVATTTRSFLARMQSEFSGLGDIRAITLVRATPAGRDVYRVDGTGGSREFDIVLSAEGVLESLRLPSAAQR